LIARLRRGAALALVTLASSLCARATPIARAELVALCADAEGPAQCARLVEARQLRKFGKLAERDGDELRVTLDHYGLSKFHDIVNFKGTRTYALWDYLEAVDTLVLFTTIDDRTGFVLVQRDGGNEYRLPSEPIMAPGDRHFVTADFCAEACENEVALWRIGVDSVRKEATWKPEMAWSDVNVTWRGPNEIAFEYSTPDESAPRTMTRRLDDPAWKKVRAR
jgi:hypothetical protein